MDNMILDFFGIVTGWVRDYRRHFEKKCQEINNIRFWRFLVKIGVNPS